MIHINSIAGDGQVNIIGDCKKNPDGSIAIGKKIKIHKIASDNVNHVKLEKDEKLSIVIENIVIEK